MNRSLLESVLHRVAPLAADGRVADADLLRRFAADRDESAFTVLVRRHGPLVWAVCRNLLPLESDAEDAFQATFLTLVRSAGTVRTPAALGAWLHGVAYRVAMKAKRTAARRRTRERTAAAGEAAAPVSQTTWDQLQIAVHEEVRRLPEPLRTAFVMCGLEGVGQSEAAAALGWKLGTLSGRLTKARQRLLDQLAKRGIPAGVVVAGAVAGGAAAIAATPPALTARVAALARIGLDVSGGISQTVLELARGATEVPMTRTKLLTAAAVLVGILAAGTATTLIPLATAQKETTQPAAQNPADPAAHAQAKGQFGGAMGGSMAAKPQWEYKFVPRKGESLEAFERLLNDYAAAGWEYCGTEALTVTDPRRRGEWGTSPTVVFKRPAGAARGMMGTTSSTGMMGMGGGMSMGGPPLPSSGMQGLANQKGGLTPSGGASSPPMGKPSMSGAAPSTGAGIRTGAMVPSGGLLAPMGGGTMGPAGGAKSPADAELTVIRLKHSQAASLAKVLDELFQGRGCRIIAEPVTNSLLIEANAYNVKSLMSVIEKVDIPGPSK